MKKAAIVTVLLCATAGIGIYRSWDTISDKLGLKELSPSRIKAIALAKSGFSLDAYRTNYSVIEGLILSSRGQMERGIWEAEVQPDGTYVVSFGYKDDGELGIFAFSVNISTQVVENLDRVVREER